MLFALILGIILIILAPYYFFVHWDEYFWGEYIKVIFYTHGFWNLSTDILAFSNLSSGIIHMYATYPPSMALFHNLFLLPQFDFTENAIVFSSLFLFATLVGVFAETIASFAQKKYIFIVALAIPP